MPLIHTSVFAAILALMLVILSALVIQRRVRVKAANGDAGDDILRCRIRVQGNFTEYVPLGLILMACIESLRGPIWLVLLMGWLLVLGRTLHALGLMRATLPLRQSGMVMTFACLLIGASWLLLRAFGARL